jgi:hypothetical protein
MSLGCRPEQQLRRVKVDVPVRPSSCYDVRHIRQAECGQRRACLGAGGRGARGRSRLWRSPGSTTQIRSRGAPLPGSCASGDDRSSCRGRSESTTQPGRIHHQARHSGGNHRWCAVSCALSLRRYRSRFAAAALQVHVRSRLGEIPRDRPHPVRTPLCCADPASPRPGITSLPPAMTGHFGGFGPGLRQAMASSGRAALTPRPRVPACRIAATGHDWPLRQIPTGPSRRDDGVVALVAGRHVHARPHRAERRNSAIASAGASKSSISMASLKDT